MRLCVWHTYFPRSSAWKIQCFQMVPKHPIIRSRGGLWKLPLLPKWAVVVVSTEKVVSVLLKNPWCHQRWESLMWLSRCRNIAWPVMWNHCLRAHLEEPGGKRGGCPVTPYPLSFSSPLSSVINLHVSFEKILGPPSLNSWISFPPDI